MKSLDRKDEDEDIQKLSSILSKLQNIYYKKKEQLEELQVEISELREVLNYLNSFLSNKSFYTADEIYSKSLEKDVFDEEEYFKEELPKEKVKDTHIKRKIVIESGEKQGKLLCVLNFNDYNKVEIKFIEPEIIAIKESSEDFIKIFLREGLIKIKENNPDLKLNYFYYKKSDIIEKIEISNLKSIEDFDLITKKIRELLDNEIYSNIKLE